MKVIANSLFIASVYAAADPRAAPFTNEAVLPYVGVDDSATGTNGVSGNLIDYSANPAKRCKAVVADANYEVSQNACEASDEYCWSEYWMYNFKLEAGEYCYIDYNDFGNFMIGYNSTDCA